MDTVPDILDGLGGVTAIANETGIPLTTVHSWKRTGFVPRWRIPILVSLAKRLGKPITEDSFPQRRAVPLGAERGRVVLCDACERRMDDPAVLGCSEPDCPRAAREAA